MATLGELKEMDKARGLGNGLLADLVRDAAEHRAEEGYELRATANDLCLKADGKMTRDDHRQIEAWALKVREMVLEINQRRKDTDELYDERLLTLDQAWEKFREIGPKEVVGDEKLARELKDRFGSEWGFGEYVGLGMGAQAIRDLLTREDLNLLGGDLRDQIATSKGQKQQRAIKRLKVVEAFRKSENKPEWMVLDAVPVIPPELRPMVQLDGGRFATSDLNDLYRRVINRNNRLKRLLDLGAPEIIVNNEKRMLQEAVDALFDNGRRGRAVTGPGNRPLKSLSDMLKGKQGRFRQNLLGKRVDYSGRSVIVAGPHLRLHQCGLPKIMALELFKPFIMSRLVERKEVQNIKAAKKMVDSMVPSVWDVLEEVISEHPVLLNRAPTLHRLGIQAFEPILVEGKAIQVHPLVCHAFNADFDGDQMAVHLPLSVEAQAEARILMLSSNNILSPANGRPLATPSQDMVIGLYYLTYCIEDLAALAADPPKDRKIAVFGSADEVELAYDANQVALQEPIWVRRSDGTRALTTAGRAIFNHELRLALADVLERDPASLDEDDIRELNAALTKREMNDYITWLVDQHGATQVAQILDTIKDLGFRFASRSGVSISKNDIVTPPDKEQILEKYEERVKKLEGQYITGLITRGERHEKIQDLWNAATDEVGEAMQRNLFPMNPVFMMANSGARGSFKQIRQLAGMRGLMANPKGEIIERPIRSNFMEGLSVLEYFISTHGARKGLADTALRTADSGYLTRRLVDVSQDVIVRQRDCGTETFVDVPAFLLDRKVFFDFRAGQITARGGSFAPRANDQLVGRVLAQDIETSDGLLPAGTPISRDLARVIYEAKLGTVQDMLETFSESKLDDPIELASRLGLPELAELFKQEQALEDPFLPFEAVDDLRTPEKFLRRMEDDGYAVTDLRDRDMKKVVELELRTLAWALNDKIERDCTVPVRSVLTCEAETGVCGACYGLSLASGERSDVGDAVGIVAAQSIGEPGTQLTMRTFHTGGVAGLDITQGLPRVVELFEARTPKPAGAVCAHRGTRHQPHQDHRRARLRAAPAGRHRGARGRGRGLGHLLPGRAHDAPAARVADPRHAAHAHRRARLARGPDRVGGPAGAAGRARADRPDGLGRRPGHPLPRRAGAAGLPRPGRGDQRQAHRGDRPADDPPRAPRPSGLDRVAPGPVRRDRRVRPRPRRARRPAGGRAAHRRSPDPRHHQGQPRDRELPVRRVVPGDHQGPHGRRDRGEDRSPDGPQGERDHRQADPGRDRSARLPEHRDRAPRRLRRQPAASGRLRRRRPRGRARRDGGRPRPARGPRPGRRRGLDTASPSRLNDREGPPIGRPFVVLQRVYPLERAPPRPGTWAILAAACLLSSRGFAGDSARACFGPLKGPLDAR